MSGALWQTIRELEALRPTFVSVTYGAGGSTRDRTVRVTERIATETTLTAGRPPDLRRPLGRRAAPASSGSTPTPASATCWRCAATRPADPRATWAAHPEGLEYADELVRAGPRARRLLRRGRGVPREAPASPPTSTATPSTSAAKADAGADFAITQFFFDGRRLLPAASSASARTAATMPIMPGIMPVTNVAQIERFAELSGAAVPGGAGRPAAGGRRTTRRRCARSASRSRPSCAGAARRRRAGPALLHAEPLDGDARDLPSARSRVSGRLSREAHRHGHRLRRGERRPDVAVLELGAECVARHAPDALVMPLPR